MTYPCPACQPEYPVDSPAVPAHCPHCGATVIEERAERLEGGGTWYHCCGYVFFPYGPVPEDFSNSTAPRYGNE